MIRVNCNLKAVLATVVVTALAVSTQSVLSGSPQDTDRTISVGQPKIWRYERVYPLLDGMLRDIEAALVQHLPLLDPNEANEAYLDFLRTLIGVQVDYNQGAGVKNQSELAKAQQSAKQQQVDSEYLTTLRQERSDTEKRILAAEADQSAAQQKVSLTKPGSTEREDAQKELDRRTQVVADLQARKKQLDTDIGQGSSSTPNFSDTLSGDTAKTQTSTLPQFLDTVPEAVKNKIWEKLDKADLPASKQFENYVTLLNERLAKQLMVIADDASRSGYQLFMMQFDVGLYPSHLTKNRVARIEFEMSSVSPAGKKPYAYTLIPGSSAYNIQQYIGRSQNFSAVGLFNLLSGLGIRGEYQRQRDQFRTGLVQAVYTSGFENGQASFGWYHGPAPFESYVTPGLRTTYALVAVPNCTSHLRFTVHKGWQDKNGKLITDRHSQDKGYDVEVPGYDATNCADPFDIGTPSLRIAEIAYQTKSAQLGRETASTDAPGPPNSSTQNANKSTNTIALVLKNPADANLTLTVGGKLLKRVRDTRGEGVLTDKTPTPPRGEFETDQFGPDSWILSNSRTLLLNISKDAAGDEFPVIRLSDSSTAGAEITSLLDPPAEVGINNWKFRATRHSPIPRSAFLPLFYGTACPADEYLKVSVDQLPPNVKVRLAFTPPDSASSVANSCLIGQHLTEAAQVVLDAGRQGHWALSCKRLGPDLVCDVPAEACDPEADCISDQSTFVYEPKSGMSASARFESAEVLPHFETGYEGASYDSVRKEWTFRPRGIHISAQDTRIQEFTSCKDQSVPAPVVVAYPEPLNYLEVTISTDFYEKCLPHEGFRPYHLLHRARRSGPFSQMEPSDIPILVTDFGWDVRADVSSKMVISKWAGLAYRLTSTWSFRPDWIETISATNGLAPEQTLGLTRRAPGLLLFSTTDQMKSSPAPYIFRLTVGAANFTVLEDNANATLCYNFQTDQTGCVPSKPKEEVGSSVLPVSEQAPHNRSKSKSKNAAHSSAATNDGAPHSATAQKDGSKEQSEKPKQ